ncbi:uncharacterized protein [Pagrus major]|uniref:uncharacterized protein n=1 Tax=Pagrus major TaxID=143350 RepID=UPI003CC879E0
MNHQVCGCCGWSKVTTYHGLRVHQGKMGCTPKGMKIPESEQSRINSYFPKPTFMGPPIKVHEPRIDIFTPSVKSYGEWNTRKNILEETLQKDIAPINSTPVKTEITATSDMSLQVCSCCGWSKVTTYQGLRVHQGKMGCTPKGMTIPESEQPRVNSYFPKPTFMGPPIKVHEPRIDIFTPSVKSYGEQDTWKNILEETLRKDNAPINSTPVKTGPFPMSLTQTFGSQGSPAVRETNNSLFQTPQPYYPTATRVCRALDFNTGPQQIQQVGHVWNIPTTTSQDTVVQINEEKEEKEREAQRLLKERQDRTRADLQQKIQWREQKMTEVRSSVTANIGSLDAEWQEINNVFREVMGVVEVAWRKALQPLGERKHSVEREAQDLVQTLQNEIHKLRETIDELDQNPDLQVSPLKGVDESRDWRNVMVDGSFSPGTLRSTTSNMMEQIQQKLEKLSSVELKRVTTFAVDVKLDPTTAHRYLVLSSDGKEVKDGDQDQKVPVDPGRFDMFGSILGLNRLTSGRSYWEVEVTRKTGWDLGVARRHANRKGELSLTPDNGYWVTVHFEDEKYAALTAPPVSLSLKGKPQKVGVFVDYDEGLVSFYDVTAQSHIYSFTQCLFGGEISPYFSPHLHQKGKNSEPLIISAVKNQK